MIPNLIIQTGPRDLPVLLNSAIATVKLLHPRFEYRLFDDATISTFLREYFPEYRAEYDSFRFQIQRYDFFRYLAIYRYGGFYLDLDVFLAQSLTPLLTSSCVFPFEELAQAKFFWERFRMDWTIGNYAFGAEPAHPFLAAIIDNCLRAKKDPEWVKPMMRGIPPFARSEFYILNTSGPGLVSRTFAENPQLVRDVKILFPEDVCEVRSWQQFGAFGVHHMLGSWRQQQRFFPRRLRRIWEQRTLKRVLADGRARGKTRNLGTGVGLRQMEVQPFRGK
jgi:inositol phosphorylceramide mannosyltransferase catalytic subunit